MTLLSPGVLVTVVDESNYLPAATNSVPFFLIATAANKPSGAGIGIAPGTLPANANQVYSINSQRELAATYGNPLFYTTSNGTPINGYELNEYGLLAAHSALGITNQAYVMRADIDLDQLTASLVRPTANPSAGTYWLDTTDTSWGLFQWNSATSDFVNQVPVVITDPSYVDVSSVPLQSFGTIGQYAVVTTNTFNPVFFKRGGPTALQTSYGPLSDLYNTWVLVGSDDWKTAWPTITGTLAPTTLTAGDQILINGVTVTVPTAPNNTVSGLANAINNTGTVISGVSIVGTSGQFTCSALPGTLQVGQHVTIYGTLGGGVTLDTFNNYPTAYIISATDGSTSFTLTNLSGGSIVTSVGTPTGVTFEVFSGVYAATINGALNLYGDSTAGGNWTTGAAVTGSITLSDASGTPLEALGITAGNYYTPLVQDSLSTQVPQWRSNYAKPAPTGSVWQKTNNVNNGMNIIVKEFDSTLETFVTNKAPVYYSLQQAIYGLDPGQGGLGIPAGTLFAEDDPTNDYQIGLQLWEQVVSGQTAVTGNPITITNPFTVGNSFTIKATAPGTPNMNAGVATLLGTTPSDFVSAVSAAAVPYVNASYNATTGSITLTHQTGGAILLFDNTGSAIETAGFIATGSNAVMGVTTNYYHGATSGVWISNFVSYPWFQYSASADAPYQDPATGTMWYYSTATQADIMIQNNGQWCGYQNVSNSARGENLTLTNASGPIFSVTPPTTQNNTAQSPLVPGDLWINTSELYAYPVISRWTIVNGTGQWVQLSDTDATTSNGIVFLDARWAPNGTTDPINDPIPSIQSMLRSNYVDPDAPDPSLYPTGMLLFNTRRSGYNVKSFQQNYFNTQDYPSYPWDITTRYTPGTLVSYSGAVYICVNTNTGQTPGSSGNYWTVFDQLNTWISISSNNEDGSPNFGANAQRIVIVKALKSAIDSSTTLREEWLIYNLLACPQYPELIPNMVVLNDDRSDTGFIVGDTPLFLNPDEVVTWANVDGTSTDPEALVSHNDYVGVFYPSCTTNDMSGNLVVTAPSHMMVRTIIRSDAVSYPWFAPAGTQRGVVDNALQIGYININTGNFMPIGVNQGQRDKLYQVNINPITFIPGVGITNFGNKSTTSATTLMNRINVARLVCFMRARLQTIGKQYLFQPNDQITRSQIANSITSLMIDLVAKRGIYDYLVVCDSSNNTPETIDRNELWVDVAVEPVTAVEFIYIPVRIMATGAIASLSSTTASSGPNPS